MHKDLLITLLKNPYVTSQNDTRLLIELTKKYPYFHSAFMLLLLNLQKTSNETFDEYLHDSALKIADRKHLFNLLHKKNTTESLTQSETEIDDTSVEIEFSQNQAIEFQEEEPVSIPSKDAQTTEIIEKNTPTDPKLLEIDESKTIDQKDAADFESDTPTTENADDTDDLEINSFEFNQKTIIERFIEENPAFAPRKIIPPEENPDISINSIKEDDDLASETLANIFEMQKLYDKAIDVYKKLILKFPEKSAYFASRIETLKKIVK